ncbi:MAG: right-handed parallel beta-helix repeat-containing protein [Planctomycetes bacterium]|nr:right-handed parallel beta-helix repeat-containing protein [Planctomycetota bacterium]
MRLVTLLVLLFASALSAATFYVDPARGKESNNGSKAAPWSTLEAVVNGGHLRDVQPGDTILLRDGMHGRVVFSGRNEDFITIAADEGCRPKLSYLEITSGTKWHIKGLTISASFGDPYDGAMLKFADGGESEQITVEDCFVYGALDASKWTAEQWMKCNSGITMGRYGKGHLLRNNYVMNTRFGIALCAEDSTCEGNVVSHFSGDGIRTTRDGQVVQHNVIRNVCVSAKDGDDNHDDAIQCFLFNKGTGTVRNVTIRENLIIMRESEELPWLADMQAIGCFDGPLIGFLVEGNVINTSHWHGVTLFDAQDCKILSNVAYTQWTEAKLRPWVQLGGKNKGEIKGNTVKDNYAYTFDLKADKDVVAENNKVVTEDIYNTRREELLKLINEKYGDVHPAAGFRRVGLEKPRWLEGRVVEGENGKVIDSVQSSLNQGKLIVLFVFTRDVKDKRGTETSTEFEREVLDDEAVGKLLDDCATVGVQLGDDLPRDVKKRYGISKSPQVVILNPDGSEAWSGKPNNAKALIKKLESARDELANPGGD